MAAEPNYRRTKPGVRSTQPSTNGSSGPSSQIPGLSATANNTEPEARTKGRRVGVQASDSDYVKLAKQGGQRGLLWHDDPVDAEQNNCYKPCSWFTDDQDGKATTPDGVSKSPSSGAAHQLDPPFGTDNYSSWESDKVDNASSGMEKLSLSQKDIDEANKFKKTSHDKKAAPQVSMSTLLGFGYVEEKKSEDDDASSFTSDQISTIAPEDELE